MLIHMQFQEQVDRCAEGNRLEVYPLKEKTMITPETELRKLGITELSSLARLLSPNAWKILMASVRIPVSNEARFNSEDIKIIEEAAKNQYRSGAEIFLDEWATMGRKRPTVATVMELLISANLLKAADYLTIDVLRGQRPERPRDGPQRDIDVSEFLNELSTTESNSDSNSKNAKFCNRSTAQMDLNNVEYPDIFSAQNFNEDVEVFEINYHEKKQQNVQDFPQRTWREKSDLIKFSRSTNNSEKIMSDLMKFSSSSIEKPGENRCIEGSQSFLPNLTQLGINSSSNFKIEEEGREVPLELVSSELPICLKNAFTKDGSGLSSQTISSGSSVNTAANVSSTAADNLYLPALSQILLDDEARVGETQVIEGEEETGPSADTEELPLTVVELFKQ